MKLTITRRVITKKNSKRFITRGRKKFLVPSVAFENYLDEAAFELRPQVREKLTGLVRVHCDFYIKGKYRVDGDNLFTSILDTLQHVGAIEDDNNVMAGSWEKHLNNSDWKTIILLTPFRGKNARAIH